MKIRSRIVQGVAQNPGAWAVLLPEPLAKLLQLCGAIMNIPSGSVWTYFAQACMKGLACEATWHKSIVTRGEIQSQRNDDNCSTCLMTITIEMPRKLVSKGHVKYLSTRRPTAAAALPRARQAEQMAPAGTRTQTPPAQPRRWHPVHGLASVTRTRCGRTQASTRECKKAQHVRMPWKCCCGRCVATANTG